MTVLSRLASEQVYACPFCPVPFFSAIGRDDHVKYRHAVELELVKETK